MTVCEQIQKSYSTLSKSQKKVADYVFSNLEYAAMKTTVKISMEAGVSETTVIRLAYALGYDSFSALQKQMQSDVLERARSRRVEGQGQQNVFQRMLTKEIEILLEMRDGGINFEQLQNLAMRISSADRVMVFGYYGEHTVSYELYMMLDAIRSNVHYYRENNVGFRELAELNPRSVVIAVAFPPYSPGTLELVEQSKRKGPYTIAITDSPLSPVGRLADDVVTLRVNREPETGINCMAPVMTYCYLLMDAVKGCNREESLYRIKNVQSQLVQPGVLPIRLDTGWDAP